MPSKGVTIACRVALKSLGEVPVDDIREWLQSRGIMLTNHQIGNCLKWLSSGPLPAVEMTGRIEAGRGRPGIWRLTRRGDALTKPDQDLPPWPPDNGHPK